MIMGVSEEVDTSLPAGVGQILPLMLTVPIESSPAEVKLLAPAPGGALVTSACLSVLSFHRQFINALVSFGKRGHARRNVWSS